MHWQDIINEFYDEFCQLAAEVGIDGAKLVAQLPQSGQLLKGNKVPVISAKYRFTCSVLFYINHLSDGSTWPYFRFFTFKHGGIETKFNGMQFIKNRSFNKRASIQPKLIKVSPTHAQNDEKDEQRRQNIFWVNAEHYFNGTDAIDCNWVKRRFNHLMSANCLARSGLRLTKNNHLLAPISHNQKGLIGYHKIFDDKQNKKHHYIIQSGLLKGSAIIIKPNQGIVNPNIAIAEGLATGLSIALVWSGTIYVALTAGNLAQVRSTIDSSQTVTFFADNDSWKPEKGNTGIAKATAAALAIDSIIYPMFNPKSQQHKPTDFNDLLLLEGLATLSAQINNK